jgi:phosphatidylglycerol:prolipoprotein diacylglycerol transferase
MCKLRKINVPDMLDLAALGFLIGQSVGRWGNFINQEAFGTLTGSTWWGMESVNTNAVCGEGLVHPCFLYESVWCALGFVLLHKLSKNRHFSGEIALGYCAWYGFARMFIEMLRTDSLMIGSFRVSVLVSFVLCASGITLIAVIRKRQKTAATDVTYSSMFVENEEEKTEETEETEE